MVSRAAPTVMIHKNTMKEEKPMSKSQLIILGIFTSVHRGYGDDIDSFALILTFINLLENGVYTPSRYYGYPFAELFYGFSGYYLGSFYSSIFVFI